MGYATVWLFGFGFLFTGYLVLAGYDYGVGIGLPVVAKTDTERRLTLNAVGPFLLGNEVWLLVAIGLLIGTLPGFESRLLDGAYPLVVVAAVGAISFIVSVQLRSRAEGRLRTFWDIVVFAGGALAAFGWGAVLAVLAGGVDLGANGLVQGISGAVSAFSLLAGLSMVALLGTHGAVFLVGRTTGPVAERATRLARRSGIAAVVLFVVTVLVGILGHSFTGSFARPAVVIVLAALSVVSVLVSLWRLGANRPWQAFAATAVAVGLLPVGVFAAKYPTLITAHGGGRPAPSVAELAGIDASLMAITWTAGPILLIVFAVQIYSWWKFRGKLTDKTPLYY